MNNNGKIILVDNKNDKEFTFNNNQNIEEENKESILNNNQNIEEENKEPTLNNNQNIEEENKESILNNNQNNDVININKDKDKIFKKVIKYNFSTSNMIKNNLIKQNIDLNELTRENRLEVIIAYDWSHLRLRNKNEQII
jgi:hypothetical protein